MSLARYANTRDGNEKAIVDGLLAIGASVVRLDTPCDLLVGYRGDNFLLEVKLPLGPKGGKHGSDLNPTQREFFQSWPGQVEIVRTLADALGVIGAIADHFPMDTTAPGASKSSNPCIRSTRSR